MKRAEIKTFQDQRVVVQVQRDVRPTPYVDLRAAYFQQAKDDTEDAEDGGVWCHSSESIKVPIEKWGEFVTAINSIKP